VSSQGAKLLLSALTLMVYSAMMVSLASPGVNFLLTVTPIKAAVGLEGAQGHIRVTASQNGVGALKN
jgi:hypothetical protein